MLYAILAVANGYCAVAAYQDGKPYGLHAALCLAMLTITVAEGE